MSLLIFIYSMMLLLICKYEPFRQEVSLDYLIDGQTDDDSSEKLIGGLKQVSSSTVGQKKQPFFLHK